MTDPFSILQTGEGRKLRINGSLPPGFHGDADGDGYLCPLDAQNAAAIRQERARPPKGHTTSGLSPGRHGASPIPAPGGK